MNDSLRGEERSPVSEVLSGYLRGSKRGLTAYVLHCTERWPGSVLYPVLRLVSRMYTALADTCRTRALVAADNRAGCLLVSWEPLEVVSTTTVRVCRGCGDPSRVCSPQFLHQSFCFQALSLRNKEKKAVRPSVIGTKHCLVQYAACSM